MELSVYANSKACGCRNAKRHCRAVVLESKRDYFTARTLTAEQQGDQGLESWDLSVFRLPRPLDKLKRTSINERVKTLVLEFADVSDKDVFLYELNLLENIRAYHQNEYEKHFREKKKRAKA